VRHREGVPISFEFLRGVVGVLCILFAFMIGRTAVGLRKGQQKPRRLYAWIVRCGACAAAVAIRHPLDLMGIGVWVVSLAALGLGWWGASREKTEEDLTHQIFPE
jgi:hypothetical protein